MSIGTELCMDGVNRSLQPTREEQDRRGAEQVIRA